eukprot:6154464-Ditylum_brightwellii.AAC.1
MMPKPGHITMNMNTKPSNQVGPDLTYHCHCNGDMCAWNINPNKWSKPECFAPVMLQLELCLLVVSAVHLKCTSKSGDFKKGILTKLSTRRSPRHWYEKAKAAFVATD